MNDCCGQGFSQPLLQCLVTPKPAWHAQTMTICLLVSQSTRFPQSIKEKAERGVVLPGVVVPISDASAWRMEAEGS